MMLIIEKQIIKKYLVSNVDIKNERFICIIYILKFDKKFFFDVKIMLGEEIK